MPEQRDHGPRRRASASGSLRRRPPPVVISLARRAVRSHAKAMDRQPPMAQRPPAAPEVDWTAFEALARGVRAGEIGAAPKQKFDPLQPGDVLPWPADGSPERQEAALLGAKSLANGEVASLVVAGGAGT